MTCSVFSAQDMIKKNNTMKKKKKNERCCWASTRTA